MPGTKVAIIYSVAQRLRRVLVIPTESDAELDGFTARLGEKLIYQPMDDFLVRGPDASVADDAGGPPLSDRCAVVDDQGVVIAHVRADPDIDSLEELDFRKNPPHGGPKAPASQLVLSKFSSEGDTYDHAKKSFLRRYALADATGLVTDIVFADPEDPPKPKVKDGQVIGSLTHQVGDKFRP